MLLVRHHPVPQKRSHEFVDNFVSYQQIRTIIVLRAAVRALVSLAVLLGFTRLVAFVYFVYFYEQINDDDYDDGKHAFRNSWICIMMLLFT